MQNRKFFAALTAAIALTAGLASCSNNDDELNPKKNDRIPITLTSNVGSRATNQSLQETMIAKGVNVGGYINQGDIKLADLQLASNGEGGFTGQNLTTDDSETSLSIYAYAPSSGTDVDATQSFTFTIKEDQSLDEATGGYIQSDLMIAKSENVTPTSSPINLTFEHKMVKLNLNFDLTDAAGVTLNNATVSVLQVVPSVIVDLANAAVTTGSDNKIDITAASGVDITSETKASVVFPSQTIKSSVDFVQIVAGDKTYTAKLPSNVEFKSGMKYAYTVKFTTSGDEGGSGTPGGTTIQLVPGSVVNPWGDGTLDQYQVGDYVTSDGTIIPKAEAANHEKRGDIVAVIFSKEVSAKDKEDGYNAYAMRLEVVGSKKWKPALDPAVENVDGFQAALNDLDGLDKTNQVLALSDYANLGADNGTVFEFTTKYPNPIGAIGSNWFVPSFGQMVQFLNAIGNANISAETELNQPGTAWDPMYYTTETSVVEALNACAEKAGKLAIIEKEESGSAYKGAIFVTVTEGSSTKFWCFQVSPSVRNDNTAYVWGFGRNPSKGDSYRSLLPCVALKLPTASPSISATAAQVNQ